MKAIIKKVVRGKNKGQFRFLLIAKNGEPVAQSHPETYHNERDLLKTLRNYFPGFEIVREYS